MPTLNQLQTEWNQLAAQARAMGLRARDIRSTHESIVVGQRRVAWLRQRVEQRRARLQGTTALQPAATADLSQVGTTFGAELEFRVPGQTLPQVAQALTDAGIPCVYAGYNHVNSTTSWKIVTDGSVMGGMELVSPILPATDEGLAALAAACDILCRLGAQVRRDCGLHIHVGARGADVGFFQRIVRAYAAAEGVIDTVLSPSRRGRANPYCQPVPVAAARQTTQDLVIRAVSNSVGRYCKLNLTAFLRHGTVEFRQHQGTVEAQKACAWARLCIAMVRAAARGDVPAPQNLAHLLGALALSPADQAYFTYRAAHFAGHTQEDAA